MKIKRTEFLKRGLVLTLSPLILSFGFICTKELIEPPISKEDKLNKSIAELPTYSIKSGLAKESSIYKIPNSAIISNGKTNMVCQIIQKDNDYFLQGVQVRVLRQEDFFSFVENLNVNTQVLLEQSSSLKYLSNVAHDQIKGRFLPIKKLN